MRHERTFLAQISSILDENPVGFLAEVDRAYRCYRLINSNQGVEFLHAHNRFCEATINKATEIIASLNGRAPENGNSPIGLRSQELREQINHLLGGGTVGSPIPPSL